VLNAGGVASRHTIYIGADGKVLAIDTAVRPATSAEDMLARLQALGVPRRP
jgi:peroxiredoxin Q/BCP